MAWASCIAWIARGGNVRTRHVEFNVNTNADSRDSERLSLVRYKLAVNHECHFV